MCDIVEKVNNIEGFYTSNNRVKRSQAFNELYLLCKNVKSCKEFSQRAISIFREYNELKEKKDNNTIELSQYDVKMGRIYVRFESLIFEIKDKFDLSQFGLYEKQEIFMRDQKNIMKESFVNIEEILINGGSPVKLKMLKIIKEQLRRMRTCFPDLMVIFQSVKEYE